MDSIAVMQEYRQYLSDARRKELNRCAEIFTDPADGPAGDEQRTVVRMCFGHIQWLEARIRQIDSMADDTVSAECTDEQRVSDLAMQMVDRILREQKRTAHKRQAEGIAAAKAKGVHFGRRPMERPPEFDTWYEYWKSGRVSVSVAAEKLGVARKTFMKWAEEQSAS